MLAEDTKPMASSAFMARVAADFFRRKNRKSSSSSSVSSRGTLKGNDIDCNSNESESRTYVTKEPQEAWRKDILLKLKKRNQHEKEVVSNSARCK